uniref:NADH dehydrogenase [ubiquinone] 1 beta subcomplex subunit 11, mitochondrial n=1 Tax=Ascaris lumbricoides TaxID=6252 RepID=A0A0M3I3N0_ASCLU
MLICLRNIEDRAFELEDGIQLPQLLFTRTTFAKDGVNNFQQAVAMFRELCLARSAAFRLSSRRSLASGTSHHAEENIERKPADYRPGSDSYAYDNPWPKLNGGRLDWLFGDGWRRPLAKDQGAKMVEFYFFSLVLKIIIFGVTKFSRRSQLIRREWIWFSQVAHDEHKDWMRFHQFAFILFTVLTTWFSCWIVFAKPDWPNGREWALREAHLEMARREKAGLPYISKDLIRPEKVAATLPSDEELRDFDILI